MTKIKVTKLALKSWNQTHFGNIHTRIKNLKTYITHLQSLPQTTLVIQMEQMAQKDLDELLLRETILWKEKAKSQWLVEGDANTHFFHLSTILHRRHNHISFIFDAHNSCIIDPMLIGEAFINFFTHLFASEQPSFPPDLQDLIAPSITIAMNTTLIEVPSNQEIHSLLSSMANNKIPGPDGIGPLFYKSF